MNGLNNLKRNKMTAIEWLIEQLTAIGQLEIPQGSNAVTSLITQAKEMEKQQQGYSEEEVIKLLQKALTHKDNGETGSLVTAQGKIRTANFYSWFEQFKKK